MGDLRASRSTSTIIQIGPSYELHHAAELGDLEKIKRLLANLGIEERHHLLSSKEDESGKLPFHFAAQGGHVDALKLLLPEKIEASMGVPEFSDTPTTRGGWSALHLASASGRTKVVQWLLTNHLVDLNLQDQEGNTPLHLAVHFGHREVVRCLVAKGANLCILNEDTMMPISFCEDQAMFDALLFTFTAGSDSSNKGMQSLTLDANKRAVLHYAALFARNSELIAKLIVEADPEQVYGKDNRGDSFLHVAAMSGNMNVLQALKKLGPVHVNMTRLLSNGGGRDSFHSPGMYALLNNHRDFFDKLVTMGRVEITLSCIIKGLIAELFDKPKIQKNLALFASTLPTYLALYANKDCIFDFLLETKLLTLSQWDDEHKRTCLHWAVVDKRMDIVEKLCRNVQLRPGIPDRDGKTALQHAFEQKNDMLMEILRGKRSFKEHEEKLERDRKRYLQALNALLVGAAVIASVTFAGWLQLPYGVEFDTLGLKTFWASNNASFFSAVAAMCVTTTALVPTPCRYVGDIVNQLRGAIVIDAGLLAISLAAFMWAFTAAGFAALRHCHIFTYQAIMWSTVAMGAFLCLIVWLGFVFQIFRCAPPKSVLFASMLPSLPGISLESSWWPPSLRNARADIGDRSRSGYPVKLRSQLKDFMDRDLVAYHASQVAPGIPVSPGSNRLVPHETMEELVDKLDISDKGSFIRDTHQQRKAEIHDKRRKELVTSRITCQFGTPNPAA